MLLIVGRGIFSLKVASKDFTNARLLNTVICRQELSEILGAWLSGGPGCVYSYDRSYVL